MRPSPRLSMTPHHPDPQLQLQLPPGFDDHARMLSDSVLHEALQHYCLLRRPTVDDPPTLTPNPQQWRLVRDRPHLRIFRSLRAIAPHQTPELLAAGSVPGSLHDVLYGVVNRTPDAMQTESLFAEGDLLDARVLASLLPPRPDDPFRSMTVKWVLRCHPGLRQQRDYVYLESTGCVPTPDGPRIGYHVVHSIQLAAVPEFRTGANILRGRLSFCYLFREGLRTGPSGSGNEDEVEVFFKGTINPQGGLRERVALGIGMDAIEGVQASVQHTVMKKLLFFLEATTRHHRAASASRTSSIHSDSRHNIRRSTIQAGSGSGRATFIQRLWRGESNSTSISADSDASRSSFRSSSNPQIQCSVCSKPLRSFSLSSRSRCRLCCQFMCSKCRITKHVITLRDQDVSAATKLEFCVHCMRNTTAADAAWVASQQIRQQEEREKRSMGGRPTLGRQHSNTWPYARPETETETEDPSEDPGRSQASTRCADVDDVVRYQRTWGSGGGSMKQRKPSVDRGSRRPTVASMIDEEDDMPIIESVEDDDDGDWLQVADELILQPEPERRQPTAGVAY